MRSKEEVVEEFRKQTICDAALRAVARKGMSNVTVQDIADEAGVAKGTIYIYFQSREEILAQTMDISTERLLAKIAAACKFCRGFRDLLEQRVRTQLQHFEDHRDFFRLYIAMSEPFGEKRLRKYPTYQVCLAQLGNVLEQAVERGDIREADVERLSIAISAVVRDIALHRLIEKQPRPVEEDVAFAVDFIMRGIGP